MQRQMPNVSHGLSGWMVFRLSSSRSGGAGHLIDGQEMALARLHPGGCGLQHDYCKNTREAGEWGKFTGALHGSPQTSKRPAMGREGSVNEVPGTSIA